MTADTEKPPSPTASPSSLATAVGVGLVVGYATSYGQGLLPDALSSLANSSGSWSLVAFLLGMLARRPWVSAIVGVLSLAAMVLGYDLASIVRGYGVATSMTAFWLTAAVVVGPFLGWGGNAVRWRTRLTPLAVGAMSGVLVGEGAYGLAYIADTTSPVYWSGSIAVGVAFLVWGGVRRFPDARSLLLASGTTALVAAAFVLVYSGRVIMWFT
ncbi:DUF6518 family protein [Nocardiopsis halotolerans]|uniref:DUF6518 family protein n=1 Tax=Nocardiopsis halotolerans TaxID=124252 RepID=UPI00034CD694|nr:DUF6518 family protein [Nocardiopsis halotolerans]